MSARGLVVHRDNRGFLVELFKGKWVGGQITLVEVAVGLRRGGHMHPLTDEKWIVVRGEGIVRIELPEGIRRMHTVNGQNLQVIDLPAGTGHDIENIGEGPLWLLYWADKPYDPNHIDEAEWSWD